MQLGTLSHAWLTWTGLDQLRDKLVGSEACRLRQPALISVAALPGNGLPPPVMGRGRKIERFMNSSGCPVRGGVP
jgi:hypothetical protein